MGSAVEPATLAAGAAAPAGDGVRLGSLDSLRGLAALVVVFHHQFLTLFGYDGAEARWMFRTPLRLLVAGRASVLLFFVLSGFVLNLSLAGRPAWGTYAARRLSRIMPPYLVATLFSAALCVAVAPRPVATLSDWFNQQTWSGPVTAGSLLRYALLVDLQGESLNNVAWSLIYEVRISLLMPLLAWWAARSAPLAAAGAVALYGAAFVLMQERGIDRYYGASTLQGLVVTLYYVPFFVAGILLSNELARVRSGLSRAPPPLAWGLAALSLLLLASGRDPLIGAGAVLLIALSAGLPAWRALLGLPPLRWLGQVSYSLYLVHLPVTAATFHLLHGRGRPAALAALAVCLSLLAAQLLYVAIERPSIALGRRLAGAAPPLRRPPGPDAPRGRVVR